MGNPSAYRDMDEMFFSSREEATYECHESPVKSTSCLKMSESTILNKHLQRRRAQRGKVVAVLSLIVLAGVGSAALYSSVDASTWRMKTRMLRGSETAAAVEPSSERVFAGDDSPLFGDAILATDETAPQDDEAMDDVVLDELDPYDEFHTSGNQLENK